MMDTAAVGAEAVGDRQLDEKAGTRVGNGGELWKIEGLVWLMLEETSNLLRYKVSYDESGWGGIQIRWPWNESRHKWWDQEWCRSSSCNVQPEN